MAKFSDYAENKILNLMKNEAWAQFPAYVALFKAVSTEEADLATLDAELEAGTITKELSGGAYARKLAGLTEATGSGGATSNALAIEFPTATGVWGTLTHVALMDALTTGKVVMWARLDAFKTVAVGDTFKINAGDLDVAVA